MSKKNASYTSCGIQKILGDDLEKLVLVFAYVLFIVCRHARIWLVHSHLLLRMLAARI